MNTNISRDFGHMDKFAYGQISAPLTLMLSPVLIKNVCNLLFLVAWLAFAVITLKVFSLKPVSIFKCVVSEASSNVCGNHIECNW